MKLRGLTPHVVTSALCFVAGAFSAQTWLGALPVSAQTGKQDAKPPQAFLAADERMEPVVREILTTIKRMDQRLENIEKGMTGAKRTGTDSSDATSKSRPR